MSDKKVCPSCAGYGDLDGAICWRCKGKGWFSVFILEVPSEGIMKEDDFAVLIAEPEEEDAN